MAVNLSPVGGVAAQFFDNNGVPLSGGFLYTYAAGTSTPQTTYTSSSGITAQANPMVLDSSGRVPGGEIWLTDGLQYKFVLQNANAVLIGTYDNIIGINSNFVNFTNAQEIQTATASQTVFTLTTMQYQPGTGSLSVFVDGVNQYGPSANYAYTETSSTVVTFVNGLHVGASVKFTTSAINASSYGNASQISYTPAGTGAVTTTVQAKLRQVVSVKDFGAVADGNVGTGAGTNNTTAFQNAINFIVSNANASGALFIPAGIYKLSSQITVPANVYIYGEGGFQSVLFAPTAFNSDGLIKFNGIGGAPSEIHNVAILGQVGGTGGSSIGLNLAANGSFGFGIWAQGFQTAIQLASSSVFLYDSVIDQNQSSATGLNITSGSTIASNIQIYNNYVGVGINAPLGDGPVTLSNIQIVQCPYIGISINTASNVQVDNCSVGSQVGGSFSYGGIYIANSSNINISNFIAQLTPTQTSGNAGITSVNSSKISVSNSKISNFYRGISVSGGSEFCISNNICSNNYDIGIYATNCDRVIISSNNCNNNGGGSSNCGIYTNNIATYALHNVVGNICTNISGGGPQNTGIYVNLTNNGGSSGFTNLVGNMVHYNNTNQISLNGLTANINQSGNY